MTADAMLWGCTLAGLAIFEMALCFASYFAGRYVGRWGGHTGAIWCFFLFQMSIVMALAQVGWWCIACA